MHGVATCVMGDGGVTVPRSPKGGPKGRSLRRQSTRALKHHYQRIIVKHWRRSADDRAGLRVSRTQLIARIDLELRLMRGVRSLVLAALTFLVMVWIALPRSSSIIAGSQSQFGLLQTYNEMLGLEALDAVRTPAALREFLEALSARSRSMQVLSDDYFHEEESELRVVSGVRHYLEPEVLMMQRMVPRVDSTAFTMTAWVESQPQATCGTYVLRKPLGTSMAASALSCWAWHIGEQPRVEFGAHDYSGDGSARQESVGLSADESTRADGSPRWTHAPGEQPTLHFEAVVVNQTAVSFFQDAQLVGTRALPRPVTDCAGIALEVGGRGARLGDVTVYARGLVAAELSELILYGSTLANIASGNSFFAPEARRAPARPRAPRSSARPPGRRAMKTSTSASERLHCVVARSRLAGHSLRQALQLAGVALCRSRRRNRSDRRAAQGRAGGRAARGREENVPTRSPTPPVHSVSTDLSSLRAPGRSSHVRCWRRRLCCPSNHRCSP
jgi:hypothetical protein